MYEIVPKAIAIKIYLTISNTNQKKYKNRDNITSRNKT